MFKKKKEKENGYKNNKYAKCLEEIIINCRRKNIVKYSLCTKIGVNKEILVERFKFQ